MNEYVLPVFAGAALLVFGALYAFNLRGEYLLRRHSDQAPQAPSRNLPFSITFARLYALIVIGAIGGLLVSTAADRAVVSAAFTLLGTIAGYLAGARSSGRGADERGDDQL